MKGYDDVYCWMDPPRECDFPRRVFIEGLIGAGKTFFANALSEITGYKLLKEPVEENPFLESYYHDMKRNAFSMQIYLLTIRLSLERAGVYMVQAGLEKGIIGDRSLGGDTVFLKTNALLGNIPLEEYKLYFRVFEQMKIECPYPDIIIFLDAPLSEIKERIKRRGRNCELSLLEKDNQYLSLIEKEYKNFCEAISRYTYVHMVNWDYFQDIQTIWQQAVKSWRESPHSRFQKILLKW